MGKLDSRINKVFVIGASGFIGGRLVEKLILSNNHTPKCLFRNYKNIARLCRFPVDLIHGDILQYKQFENLVADCDIFVFSVHGKDKNKALSWRVNTEGLENMLKLAVKHTAKQFIFLSTTAIYESQFDKGLFDESFVPTCKKKDYARGKLEGEKLCFTYSKKYNLPVTILRPTIVYGPFAPSFTIYPAELLKSNTLKEYSSFSGICNPVYIDDVVDVIIHCMLNEKSYNDVFIVSSGETITWKKFFNEFSIAITGKSMQKSSRINYLTKSLPLFLLKKSLKFIVQIAPSISKNIYRYIQSKGLGNWGWVKGQDISTIKINFYKKELEFKTNKLRTKLDYEPMYNFNRGFKVTAAWLKHHRYIKKQLTTTTKRGG